MEGGRVPARDPTLKSPLPYCRRLSDAQFVGRFKTVLAQQAWSVEACGLWQSEFAVAFVMLPALSAVGKSGGDVAILDIDPKVGHTQGDHM
jgi:hypothetical protein